MPTKSRRKNTLKLLPTSNVRPIVPYPMRDMILDELRRREWTIYKLAKAVRGKMSRQTVYAYLAGKHDMLGEPLWHLLTALDFEIRPKR